MKLHLGSGVKFLKGYTHIDANKHPHIDHVTDVRSLSFVKTESVEEIYASHVLEHFNRLEVLDVLKEWNRVLCIGGVMRLAVPDFEAVVDEYNEKHNLDVILGLLYGGQDYQHNFHYQAYDFNRLKLLLEKTGFTDVARYNWRDFLPDDYDDFSRAYIPHMDFENGRLMSLNIVARKGE